MSAEEGALTGYLVVKVLEAAGHNSEDVEVWDPSINEAYVKGVHRLVCAVQLCCMYAQEAGATGRGDCA